MGPIRQSLAVVTIGAVKPNQRSSDHRNTLAALEPSRGPPGPGPPITCGLASSNWPPGPSKRRGACEPK
jgi:hypothetical protein